MDKTDYSYIDDFKFNFEPSDEHIRDLYLIISDLQSQINVLQKVLTEFMSLVKNEDPGIIDSKLNEVIAENVHRFWQRQLNKPFLQPKEQ